MLLRKTKRPHCSIQGDSQNQSIDERRIIMKISARNQFKGKVVKIEEGAVNAIVKIDIGGGNIFSATISMASVNELGLEVGKEAYAVVKATSVMVAVD